MRYDTPIYFCRCTPGAYDASTGNYADDSIVEVKRYGNVQNTDEQTVSLLYGSLKQGVKTITLQRAYNGLFDDIRIGERHYVVGQKTNLRFKQILIVSEVQ